MKPTIVKPLLSEHDAKLVEETLEACRQAAQSAYPVAKRLRAESASDVMRVAAASLAGLNADLALSVARGVADEVKDPDGYHGPRRSCRLGHGCVILRKNQRVRILTLSGERVRAKVREHDQRLLVGERLAGPSYLQPDPDGEGFLLHLQLAGDGQIGSQLQSGTGLTCSSRASATPSATPSVPMSAGIPICGECGSEKVHEYEDRGSTTWHCDECHVDMSPSFEPHEQRQQQN